MVLYNIGMDKYVCIDCGKSSVNKKEIPPKRCKGCYLKNHRRKKPISCWGCGKILAQTNSKTRLCRICYLKKGSKKFDDIDWDSAFGNWLAGFVDGEGNFNCHKDQKGGFVFRINLREDDKEILEEIKRRLGVGDLYYRDIKKNMNNWDFKYQSKNMQNQWTFAVNSIYDLVNTIVPYFDKYKLRAKKRLQYEEWKGKFVKKYAFLKEGDVG